MSRNPYAHEPDDAYKERCGFCYEEWPCRGSVTGRLSGIQEWLAEYNEKQMAERQARREAEQLRKLEIVNAINHLLDEAGVDPRYRQDTRFISSSIHLPIEEMYKIVERFRSGIPDNGGANTDDPRSERPRVLDTV